MQVLRTRISRIPRRAPVLRTTERPLHSYPSWAFLDDWKWIENQSRLIYYTHWKISAYIALLFIMLIASGTYSTRNGQSAKTSQIAERLNGPAKKICSINRRLLYWLNGSPTGIIQWRNGKEWFECLMRTTDALIGYFAVTEWAVACHGKRAEMIQEQR